MAEKTAPSAIDDVLAEYAGLETQLADPALHNDPDAARRVGKRFAELAPVMTTYKKLSATRDDLEAARELAADDAAFAAFTGFHLQHHIVTVVRVAGGE